MLSYKKEIEGLRGLAVIATIFFHANVPYFGGGYIGVDIFFVISGYLITSIIYNDILNNRLRLINFYAKRIKRLFPAFYVMLLFCSIGAYCILMPFDFENFLGSFKAAILFISNIYSFYDTGYFSATSQTKPFLHLWSISVEWQFYILFPILMIIINKFAKKYTAFLIGILCCSSFLISLYVFVDRNLVFYLFPFRAWELMLGSFIAVFSFNNFFKPDKLITYYNYFLVTGLFLVIVSIPVYEIFAHNYFPGPTAIIPCLGACLILISYDKCSFKIKEILAYRPLVKTGNISYSLYLWHWPLIILYQYRTGTQTPVFTNLIILAIAGIISIFSTRFIERPIRRIDSKHNILILFSAILLSFCILILHINFSDLIPSRLPPHAAKYASYAQEIGSAKDPDLGIKNQQNYDFLLLGDSHAAGFTQCFHELATKYNLKGRSWYSVSIYLGGFRKGFRQEMEADQNGFLSFIKKNKVENVIIITRHALYIHGFNEIDIADKSDLFAAYADDGTLLTDPVEAFRVSFARTIKALKRLGVKNIFILKSVPELGFKITNVPKIAAQRAFNNLDATQIGIKYSDYLNRVKIVNQIFSEYNDLIFIDPSILLCPDKQKCIAVVKDTCLYYDDDHLSYTGTKYIEELFHPAMTTIRESKFSL